MCHQNVLFDAFNLTIFDYGIVSNFEKQEKNLSLRMTN